MPIGNYKSYVRSMPDLGNGSADCGVVMYDNLQCYWRKI